MRPIRHPVRLTVEEQEKYTNITLGLAVIERHACIMKKPQHSGFVEEEAFGQISCLALCLSAPFLRGFWLWFWRPFFGSSGENFIVAKFQIRDHRWSYRNSIPSRLLRLLPSLPQQCLQICRPLMPIVVDNPLAFAKQVGATQGMFEAIVT
jgi:hypothetical protein